MNNLFDEQVAYFQMEVLSKEEAMHILAQDLYKKGVVKESYYEALLKREQVFPTGLSCNKYCVAIPHTDMEHVNKSQIAFMNLSRPVKFVQMGSEQQEINVNMIFMMALNNHDQIEMIMTLMEVFQNEELMEQFSSVNTYENYEQLVKKSGLIQL